MSTLKHTSTHPLCRLCGRCLFAHLCAVERHPDGRPTCNVVPVTGPGCK